MTMLDNGPDLMRLANNDRRVARDLAAAERERRAMQQRIAGEDAAAERKLRMQSGELQLAEQRDQVKAARAERRRLERQARREAKRQRRQQRRQDLTAWWSRRVAYVRDNAAAVYSGLIYGLAVSGAVYGQVDAARANGLPTPVGVIAAVAIEGTGLAMALTAQQQRLKGERALVARSLVWICTAAAVGINAVGHHADPVKAGGLSFLSALGIVVYEVRSGAKHRKALREAGMIPDPPERFGWRRWLTYPRETFAAWRADVRDRISPGAKVLIDRAEVRRAEKRRLAAVAQERQRQQEIVAEVADRARKAASAATKKGEAGPALSALVQLAHTGTPAPLLALPSRARVEAETARAEAEAARRAQAEAEARAATAERRAEAEAANRCKAEAEARAAVDRATAEAEAAIHRAEAEAANRRKAEAEAASAMRRAEAEAAAAALARRAEAEARAATAERRAEAEAARDEVRSETARASRMQGQLDSELAEWRRRLQAAEAEAAQTRRELAETQQARHRAEALAEAAAREASELRAALAQAAADSARRPRRTTSKPATPAEPVLLDGRPVPHVDRVSPETVRAILLARKANPDATQKELAALTKVSDRTVRAVLTAVAPQAAAVG